MFRLQANANNILNPDNISELIVLKLYEMNGLSARALK